MTSELSIVSMLKMSILALELLPGNASGGTPLLACVFLVKRPRLLWLQYIFYFYVGIVVISDGVFGLPNAAVVHTLLAQLRSHTVCCSFVKVGSPFQSHCRYDDILSN